MARARLRVRTLGVGAALLGLGSLGFVTSSSALADSPAVASALPSLTKAAQGVPDSSGLHTPMLASGRLVSVSGRPLAGVKVFLALEPSNQRLGALKVGQGAPLRFISTATTTPSGAWTVRSPAQADLSGGVARAGDVNFAVVAAGSGWFASTSFGGRLDRSTAAARTSGRSALRARADGRTGTLTLASRASLTARATPVTSSAPRVIALAPTANPGGVICSYIFDKDLGAQKVVVGKTYVDAPDVTTDFNYGEGQSTSLGVAVSASGASGSFKASGTTSQTSEDLVDWPAYSGAVNRAYETNFDFRRYVYMCSDSNAPQQYQVRAGDWYGGASYTSANDIAAGYCDAYVAGARFVMDKHKALQFASGANLSSVIGIDLSAQTGYSTNAEIVYHLHDNGHPICGLNAHPGVADAGLVQVHASITH